MESKNKKHINTVWLELNKKLVINLIFIKQDIHKIFSRNLVKLVVFRNFTFGKVKREGNYFENFPDFG